MFQPMHQIKDTLRATVRIGYDGRVHKTFRGPKADERFANEVRVLRHLEKQVCPFVPKLLDEDPEHLKIVTTSCGNRVEHLDEERAKELFAELESLRGAPRRRGGAKRDLSPIGWPLLLDRFRVFNDPSGLRRTGTWISNAQSRLTSSGSA